MYSIFGKLGDVFILHVRLSILDTNAKDDQNDICYESEQ